MKKAALFFDVDGTLIDEQTKICLLYTSKNTCRQKQITRYEKRWPYESDREPYNSGIIV